MPRPVTLIRCSSITTSRLYFWNCRPGTAARAQHLKDETDFVAAAQAGTLPAVSFVKPIGLNNEHPGYTDLLTGELHTMDLVKGGPIRPGLEAHGDRHHLRRDGRLLGSCGAARR